MNAVVTGTSGQLGPVWVETLNEMGYLVQGIDLPEYDVCSPIDMAKAQNWYETPDVLVLNAAIDNPPGSDSTFHGNFEQIMETNITGAVNTVRAFMPAMMASGGGTIIGISSIQGFVGADWRNYTGTFQKPVGYNCSKAALMQYARSLTVQYGRWGIRACCIAFGPYDGGKLSPDFLSKILPNIPLNRPVSRQSLKAALRFAIECPEFAGQTCLVDGGYVAW